MANNSIKLITGASIVLPHGNQTEGTVVIENGRIQSVGDQQSVGLLLSRPDVEVISGNNCYLTPGLIELHFNGAFGCNLNQTSLTQLNQLMRKLPERGITSAVLTAITAPITDLLATINTLEEAIHHKVSNQCRILGLHLEGPFINRACRGTHPAEATRPLNRDDLSLLRSPNLKMLTIAPEQDPGNHLIRELSDQGILISLGHTSATYEETRAAVAAGARSITHLYNAMRPFHHRDPGIIGYALTNDDLFVQIIGDGPHVHPEALRLVLRAKRPGHVMLTSDASPLAGLPEGAKSQFSHQTVTLQNGRPINEEGHLAGSAALIDGCLRNLVAWDLLSFPEAVQLASLNIARFLGEDHLGRIESGARADLVLWNKTSLDVEATLINGHEVFRRKPAHTSAE